MAGKTVLISRVDSTLGDYLIEILTDGGNEKIESLYISERSNVGKWLKSKGV